MKDPFLAHEALDRASLAVDYVQETLADHQFLADHPDIKSKVDKAVELLAEAYQDIGRIRNP